MVLAEDGLVAMSDQKSRLADPHPGQLSDEDRGDNRTDPVEWLVDGMNLIGSRPDGWWRDRSGARRRLVAELAAFAAGRKERVLVVFDGRPSAEELAAWVPGVEVAFAPGGPNAADRRIAAIVTASAARRETTVVTSDTALADEIRALGSAVMGVGAFRRLLQVR